MKHDKNSRVAFMKQKHFEVRNFDFLNRIETNAWTVKVAQIIFECGLEQMTKLCWKCEFNIFH